MATVIAAREGALAQGADAVSVAYATILDSTRRVQADLGEINGLWSGESATAYHALVTRWSEDAAALAGVLTELENALRGTANDQAAGEEARSKVLGSLNALMGGE
jgi:WXG100 family type VII secretion target